MIFEMLKQAHVNHELRDVLRPYIIKMANLPKVAFGPNDLAKLVGKPGTFGIISPYHTIPKDLSDIELDQMEKNQLPFVTKKQNKIRLTDLVQELHLRGYRKFHPLRGMWRGTPERSLLVPGISPRDLFELGRMFNQESVIFKSEDGVVGMYYTRQGNAVEVAVDVDSGDPAYQSFLNTDEGFSRGRNFSFNLDFVWGRMLPWDGRSVYTRDDIERVLPFLRGQREVA